MRRRPGVDSQGPFSRDCKKNASHKLEINSFARKTPRANARHVFFVKTKRNVKSNRFKTEIGHKILKFVFRKRMPKVAPSSTDTAEDNAREHNSKKLKNVSFRATRPYYGATSSDLQSPSV